MKIKRNARFLVRRKGSKYWTVDIRFPPDFDFWATKLHVLFDAKHHFTLTTGETDEAKALNFALKYIAAYRTGMAQYHDRKAEQSAFERHFQQAAEALPPPGSPYLPEELEPANWVEVNIDEIKVPLPPPHPHQIRHSQARFFQTGVHQDGPLTRIVRDDGTITVLNNETGEVVQTEANPVVQTLDARNATPETAEAVFQLYPGAKIEFSETNRPKAAKRRTVDDELLEYYFDEMHIKKRTQHEAKDVHEKYKRLTGKSFAKSTREDVQQLVEFLRTERKDKERTKETVQRLISPLAAACNLAVKDGKFGLERNPFVSPMRKWNKELEKNIRSKVDRSTIPFTEPMMRRFWTNLHLLREEDQVLWKFLATTGARLDEMASVKSEGIEEYSRLRYVNIGSKNDGTHRMLPVAPGIGIPNRLTKRLVPGTTSAAGKRLNDWVQLVLGEDHIPRRTTVKSLRRRFGNVIANIDVADKNFLERHIMGHEPLDVHDKHYRDGMMHSILKVYELNLIDGTFKFPDEDTALAKNPEIYRPLPALANNGIVQRPQRGRPKKLTNNSESTGRTERS